MSDTEDIPSQLESLENSLRAIIVIQHPSKETGETEVHTNENEMEERMLDQIQSFDEMNEFFDDFDAKIALPNEGHIKYDVGSDGLVVFVVDSFDLKDKVLNYIDAIIGNEKGADKQDQESAGEEKAKKRKI